MPESANLHAADTLGRFTLRRPLGRGAQSTVWLAHDPRLEREVAIKVLHASPDDQGAQGTQEAQAMHDWLQEARSVGRVKHPGIVPVYEADIEHGHAYLVFEYVDGQTLAALIARDGAWPARQAVACLLDVLDALAAAHALGVVHRDIKPSNILIDAAGRARLLDFGIATRTQTGVGDGPPVELAGTIAYLSPEALAGAAPAPSMDLFGCALVLAELLMGQPLVQEADAARAMARLANEQQRLPAELPAGVDEALRAIIERALVREPTLRYADARSFFQALSGWLQPAVDLAPQGAASNAGTLEFLLRRMRHKSDFPALSESVVRIQSMASSDTESVNSVTNQILKDVALTNKLLRVVNSAHFAHRGSIKTVSRAVTLVGFNGIRNMALSLVLLERMQDKAHAGQLKDEFVRSLLAATIGAELCAGTPDAEEAFIGAMFHGLGRLLTQFYFPEEAAQVRALLLSAPARAAGASEAAAPAPQVTEDSASTRVLGLSYEALGLGVARAWGLPASIQKCMRQPASPMGMVGDGAERLGWAAQAANDIAAVMLGYPADEVAHQVANIARHYAPALGTSQASLAELTEQARVKLVEMATAMEIRVKPGSPAHRVLHAVAPATGAPRPVGPGGVQGTQGDQGSNSGADISRLELHATQTRLNLVAPQPASALVAETLSAGIQDITNAMVEDFKLSDILRMILETMFRAMRFDRIIFCMRDVKTDTLTGRFGLGSGVEDAVRLFRVPLKAATPDLFALVCTKGVDSMISDASDARIAHSLPAWYRQSLNAPAFLLLPLQLKGNSFGLIYADKTEKGALELDEKELALLRTLRNQAVMAFKQSR